MVQLAMTKSAAARKLGQGGPREAGVGEVGRRTRPNACLWFPPLRGTWEPLGRLELLDPRERKEIR